MIEIVKCGALTSVQDRGRFGHRHLGIVQAGIMDWIAQHQANLLLGNALNAAVIEVSLGPLHMKFHTTADIVLMGADYRATLKTSAPASDRAPTLLPGYIHRIPAGGIVRLTRPSLPGMRCCIAVSGGIDVPEVLGSRSTDLAAGFGGHAGRALQAGDLLHTGSSTVADSPALYCGTSRPGIRPLRPGSLLRAVRGPEYSLFRPEAAAELWRGQWRIDPQSNRMGLRLTGRALRLQRDLNLSSVAVLPGTVRVPPDGQPIVLANDAQTMGGYPRIASVIAADLWQLAYMPPGSNVLFQEVSLEEALRLSSKCRRLLQLLEQSLLRWRVAGSQEIARAHRS